MRAFHRGIPTVVFDVQFQVRVENESLPVHFGFGGHADIEKLRLWSRHSNPHVHESLTDAVEYARYAAKRWRSYPKDGRTLTGSSELREPSESTLAVNSFSYWPLAPNGTRLPIYWSSAFAVVLGVITSS